jgi:glycerol-3-phosphate responsive antiterminator
MSFVISKTIFRLLSKTIQHMHKQMNLTVVLVLGVVLNRRSVRFIKSDK